KTKRIASVIDRGQRLIEHQPSGNDKYSNRRHFLRFDNESVSAAQRIKRYLNPELRPKHLQGGFTEVVVTGCGPDTRSGFLCRITNRILKIDSLRRELALAGQTRGKRLLEHRDKDVEKRLPILSDLVTPGQGERRVRQTNCQLVKKLRRALI